MTTNQRLLDLTAGMPCKQINLQAEIASNDCSPPVIVSNPYLQRYYAGTTRDNKDVWLHRFLSADSERHLHCHPMEFNTYMLNGSYTEQRRNRITKEVESIYHGVINADIDSVEKLCKRLNHGIEQARPWSNDFVADNGAGRRVDVFDWHRIEYAEPETWTMLIVDPDRLPFWFFENDKGEFEQRKGSPRDWWKSYGVRGQNRGDVL